MSLITANKSEIVKKQLLFKLRAYIDSFSSMIGIQLLAILFSLSGVANHGFSSDNFSINLKYLSSDLVIAFTMIWVFVTAITITTKPNRHHDFSYVTNRMTSSLSNILFLLVASVLGSITSMLASRLIGLVGYFLNDNHLYMTTFSIGDMLLGIYVTILYVFLASSLGYLVGALVQLNKVFVLLIPAFLLGSLFLGITLQREPMITEVFQFYFTEPSLFIFHIKVVLSIILLFLASSTILNRLEVRR